MLTHDMKRIIEEQLLGFVATTASDGTPNLSPKGAFFVVDDNTIAFGEVRSPGTIRNLRTNPRIEINFVDPFVRKGYRFAGTAVVVERGADAFETLLGGLSEMMNAGSVTIHLTETRHHRLQNLRSDRCGGVVVEVKPLHVLSY